MGLESSVILKLIREWIKRNRLGDLLCSGAFINMCFKCIKLYKDASHVMCVIDD